MITSAALLEVSVTSAALLEVSDLQQLHKQQGQESRKGISSTATERGRNWGQTKESSGVGFSQPSDLH